MKKTGLLWAVLLGTGFNSFASDPVDPREDRQTLIRILVKKVERDHYNGSRFDDSSSVFIWRQFLKVLDRQKSVFLKEDSVLLSKYLYNIDEELHSNSLEFYEAAYGIYSKRVGEIRKLYATLLAIPVSLTEHGSYDPAGNAAAYAVSADQRAAVWKKQLQFQVFSKMMELRSSPSFSGKSMTELELTARQKLQRTLETRYAGSDPATTEEYRFADYINTVLSYMDPHTRWNPPAVKKPATENIGKRYYGIGVQLEDISGRTHFRKVLPGGTAFASGKIRENDELLQVGNSEAELADVSGLNVIEISNFIRGDKDTHIWVTVKYPEGNIETIHLKRGEIIDSEIRARSAVIKRPSQKIGYLYLSKFYANKTFGCADDLKRELEKLKAEGVSGIIVDLRGNPGGDMGEALRIIGMFIPKGPTVHLKGKERISTYELPADNIPVYDGPLAVMINGGSGSASELFSGVMQDYGRGLVIGSNSYGKGTAQYTIPIGRVDTKAPNNPAIDMGSLVFTYSKFYRASGASTQLKGVKPDIELPSTFTAGFPSESSQPSALPWDEIPTVAFTKVQDITDLKQAVELQLSRSPELKQIRMKLDSIRIDNESAWSLNWSNFAQQWQLRKARVEAMNQLLKLPAGKQLNLSATGNNNDDETISKWRKTLVNDLYLSEAVQSMEVMISK